MSTCKYCDNNGADICDNCKYLHKEITTMMHGSVKNISFDEYLLHIVKKIATDIQNNNENNMFIAIYDPMFKCHTISWYKTM